MIRSISEIHPADWRKVAKKQMVKRIMKHAEAAGVSVDSIYVSPAFGSVYVTFGLGEYDADYECFDRIATLRIADHERTSSDHAMPDFNFHQASQISAALAFVSGLAAN